MRCPRCGECPRSEFRCIRREQEIGGRMFDVYVHQLSRCREWAFVPAQGVMMRAN